MDSINLPISPNVLQAYLESRIDYWKNTKTKAVKDPNSDTSDIFIYAAYIDALQGVYYNFFGETYGDYE